MQGDSDGRVRNELAAAAERKSRVLPPLYPETLAERPSLISPATAPDGTDLVLMLTREGRWAVVPASAPDAERRERQCRVDGREVHVEAHDTKGVQESIFDDGLEGYFYIEIRRPPTPEEEALLHIESAFPGRLDEVLTTHFTR